MPIHREHQEWLESREQLLLHHVGGVVVPLNANLKILFFLIKSFFKYFKGIRVRFLITKI
jgi:hypothetical protein